MLWLHRSINEFCSANLSSTDMEHVARAVAEHYDYDGCRNKGSGGASFVKYRKLSHSSSSSASAVTDIVPSARNVAARLEQWRDWSDVDLKLALLAMQDDGEAKSMLVNTLRSQLRYSVAKYNRQ